MILLKKYFTISNIQCQRRLRPLKAWFGPNLHKIYPKVITMPKFAGKLSNLATVENLTTLTQFCLQVSIIWVKWPVKAL